MESMYSELRCWVQHQFLWIAQLWTVCTCVSFSYSSLFQKVLFKEIENNIGHTMIEDTAEDST